MRHLYRGDVSVSRGAMLTAFTAPRTELHEATSLVQFTAVVRERDARCARKLHEGRFARRLAFERLAQRVLWPRGCALDAP
jgi:hypothetical protein